MIEHNMMQFRNLCKGLAVSLRVMSSRFSGSTPMFAMYVALSSIVVAQEAVPPRFPVPAGGPYGPRGYVCQRTTRPVIIDGVIDEADWSEVAWTEPFTDIEGNMRLAPRYKTRAKMLWDDAYLYIAAELKEPHLQARLLQRDTVIFYDNDFEVFIDPDGDTHGYYEIEMNAYNTVWDLLLVRPYRDNGPCVDSWTCLGMKSAVHLYGTINDPNDLDDRWTLEMALPWESLRETNGDKIPVAGAQWRINFSRVEWRTEAYQGAYRKSSNPATGKQYPEDNWVWSPQWIINMHYPEMWGFVQFSAKKAGEAPEQFEYRKQEDVKWELRRLYYAQNTFRMRNSRYAGSIDELKSASLIDWQPQFAPQLKSTQSIYEITAQEPGGKSWHINNEGRTWSD
jgi:hypothetical protein